MLKLSDAAALADSRGEAPAPPELLHLAGHYRLNRITQPVLEDLRQRLSRKGVSLADFQQTYLPYIKVLLEAAVASGSLGEVPRLFDYDLQPLPFRACCPPWLEDFSTRCSKATLTRYQGIIKRFLTVYWGDTDLRELDGPAMDAYRRYYLEQRGGAPSLFSSHIAILYSILDFYVAKAIAEHGQDSPPQPKEKPLLLKDVAPYWLESLPATTPDALKETYKAHLEQYLLPNLGLSDLRRFNPRRIQDYQAALKRSGGAPFLKTHVDILNQILRYAAKKGLMDAIPALRAPQKRRPHDSHPEPSSIPPRDRMMEVINSDPSGLDVLIVRLAWQLGLFSDEIRFLKWSQLDLAAKTAHVSGREIPIPDELCGYLSKRRGAAFASGDSYVVSTASHPEPYNSSYIFRLAKELLWRFGLGYLSFEEVRQDYYRRQKDAYIKKQLGI
ncbi:site-specific integrase [Flavonifractor sp. An10]|uniref:tyrosine-type recombinase/integrase n=1 Tax=Flavonifractor sp. An10 TaxID=1965537 RepID=UPI000B36A35A|nr:site-specific integrase [Flavonifractor sp. An10]